MLQPEAGSVVELRGVGFAYRQGEPVLSGIDCRIAAGVTLVVGPNGAGKSTLLRLMAGVERPTEGTIELGGNDLWAQEIAARRGLAYIPEQPDLSPYATLEEILRLVCRLREVPTTAVSVVLERAGLAGQGRRSVRELSMGQRRRGLLAAAWIGTPSIAILDEPLEAMDRSGRDLIVDWVEKLRSAAASILVATHEIEPFVDLADRVLSVRGGEVELVELSSIPSPERLSWVDRRARGQV